MLSADCASTPSKAFIFSKLKYFPSQRARSLQAGWKLKLVNGLWHKINSDHHIGDKDLNFRMYLFECFTGSVSVEAVCYGEYFLLGFLVTVETAKQCTDR